MTTRNFTLIIVLLSLTGCGTTTKYHWGSYESSLYKHYKNSADQEQFSEALAITISDGERNGRVPPGIYAEYGYLLYSAGQYVEAIPYFEKEKKAWPESIQFMDKIIENAKKGASAKTSASRNNNAGVDK